MTAADPAALAPSAPLTPAAMPGTFGTPPVEPSRLQDLRLLWFMALCLCVVTMYRGVWDPDESRYAEIPREMLVRGDWRLPSLNGFTYLEKPQVVYWPTLFLYKLLGVAPWVARLVPSLYFLGTLTLVYDFCRRFLGREIAYAAAGMLLFQPLFGFLGLMVLTDGPLTFWLTLALVAVGRLRLSDQPSRTWAWLFWLGCLGAFFSKGLIGLLFPVGIFALDLLVRGNIRQLTRMGITLALGLLVTLTVCGQWLYTMSSAVPNFTHYFFVTQHWDRFTGQQHAGTWFVFLVALPGFAWPWWPLWRPVLKNNWRALRMARGKSAAVGAAAVEAGPILAPAEAGLRGFLVLWFLAIYVFFSLSRGQLITYFLPAVPPLMMLLALEFHRSPPERQRACVLFTWMFGWLVAVGLTVLLFSLGSADRTKVEVMTGPVSTVVAGLLLILVNMLFYLLFGHRFLPRKAGRDPLMGYMLLLLACALGIGHLSRNQGSAPVEDSLLVARVAAADPGYVAVHWSEHVLDADRADGLNYALQREVVHVGAAVVPARDGTQRSELLYCTEQTSAATVARCLNPTWKSFVEALQADPVRCGHAVLLFVPRNRETELPADLLPVEPPQIVGRFIVYHLRFKPAGAIKAERSAAPAQ